MHCGVRMSPRGGVAVRGFVSGRGPPLRGGKDSPERAYRPRWLVRTDAFYLSFFIIFAICQKTDYKITDI